jgi:vancomycin aglycone glucosyltransferase
MRALLAAVGTRGDVQPIRAAADGCDVTAGANAHQHAGPSIAERFGLGCVTAVYAPVALPSPERAPPLMPGQPEPEHRSIDQRWRETKNAWNERSLERVNHNRGKLGLAPIDDALDYTLTDDTWLAADAALAAVLATPGRKIFQTRAWVLADRTPLPAELERFLDGGDPPVLVGFGSMPAAEDVSRPLIGTARAAGRRILLSKGWAGLEPIDDAADCFGLGDVSHEMLLPRVAAFHGAEIAACELEAEFA